ncbi:formyltransferase family protein [Adhaeribacter soli]|uniref:phosphoribosylglycinamide formyltransferase 1 n=1 Tax=Adhaeribacter soli TaxID=2607655 RepID=A0A5N1IMK4_9BACT|nr:formyltransferase family protein [Adhaeribacter soli]KAA9327385.1 hypothetical protein F0P94_15840 [Adhaeribacter soli]
MRIVLVAGNQPNQKALANKVAAEFELAGVVLEKSAPPVKKASLEKVLKKLKDLLFFKRIADAWKSLMAYYNEKYAAFPAVKTFFTESANSPETFEFIKALKPDLIMISGTSLIRKPFFELNPPKGIVNLHTGLSPYVKGGPNCTNWCLANNEFHLIGNTIMWLSVGIDSGNIITTEFVDFTGKEDLNAIHRKVMEDAHALYLKALRLIRKDASRVPSIKQAEITKGALYTNKMWTEDKKRALLSNIKNGRFNKVINSEEFKSRRASIKTVPLPAVSGS